MEEKIIFQSKSLQLEGRLALNSMEKGVIITHPHSLYGGDMYNVVVETLMQAYGRKNYTTLRFNFRGVGNSQGHYEDGIGEQNDVNSAICFLKEKGISQIILAGYSFGAWVNAHLSCENIHEMVMVSPPVHFLDFSEIEKIPCLKLVVVGDSDEFAPKDDVKKAVKFWNENASVEVISLTSHFYTGALPELERILKFYAK